jgi:hypothetical protein
MKIYHFQIPRHPFPARQMKQIGVKISASSDFDFVPRSVRAEIFKKTAMKIDHFQIPRHPFPARQMKQIGAKISASSDFYFEPKILKKRSR